jgi:rhodanese-related sulfurtransferase
MASELVPGAVVLDLRADAIRRRRPVDGARFVDDPLALVERPEQLDKGSRYMVVCDEGQRSGWLARHLRQLGFDAWVLVPPAP